MRGTLTLLPIDSRKTANGPLCRLVHSQNVDTRRSFCLWSWYDLCFGEFEPEHYITERERSAHQGTLEARLCVLLVVMQIVVELFG